MNSTAEQLEAPPAPAGDRPLRVLVVENGPGEGQPTARALLARHDGGRYALDWRARYADGLAAIRERRHDVYLIAGQIAGASGVELVREAFSERRFAPVIMLGSDLDDEAALALGVTDQIKAHELALPVLERAIRHAVRHHGALTELARSEERYSLAIRAANDGIWDWDLIDGTFYVSPRWCAILGRAQADAARDREPTTWFDVVHPGDLPRLRAAIDAHLAGRTAHLLIEHRMRHADGGWRWVVARGLASRDERAAPVRMAGSLSDVTDRRMAQRRLAHDALHDTLTGLPNRTLFADRVAQALRRARRDPSAACAVLFLDVDRFKLVNDSLSHAVGDRLLIALAECVATALRPGDTVARLGGDEFAVLLEEVVDADDALLVCERIMRSLTLPFHIDGHELFASVSIGIALGAEGLEAGELIGGADIAMFDAKRRGRGRCAIFDEGMRRRAVHRLARENELRQVVEGALLGIHYQPIVEIENGQICGLEALARWPAERGSVAPAEFIPIAEETGVISSLGRQVLRAALTTLAGWRRDGLVAEGVCVSVNLSGRQLDDPGLAEQVRAAIELAQLPPQALKLEITESTLISGLERTQSVFAEVCAGGVGLHLDDFGTGYSSLSALHRFPVDAIKIDRSFVAELTGADNGNEAIVRSTVAMAHGLGLPVIAEGIETPEQLRRLRDLGCEYGQGHLFSPALSAPEATTLLRRWRPSDVTALLTAG